MNLWTRLSRWLRRKSTMPIDGGSLPTNLLRRSRTPTPSELFAELKGTAWTCASINASVCASLPPRLFVSTTAGQPRPRCLTRSLDPATAVRLAAVRAPARPGPAPQIEEVIDHPLLALLRQVNPSINAFDLWELTQMSLDVQGSAYWLLDLDPILEQPHAIWVLPAQLVTPRRDPASPRLVDYYEYRGQTLQTFAPNQIVHFRYPDPADPYSAGLSPLRACFDQVTLASDYAAFRRAVYENSAVPSVLLTPDEGISPEERTRLERQWREKLGRGGQGKALVSDASLKVTVLSHSMGDLAALADSKASKEDIANAFHVPLPFLSGETNLANMQAADHLHKSLAILPRLRRRDEKLNSQLVPFFDPTGRLFFATPDPTPANQSLVLEQEQADLQYGVRTINEIRCGRGLAPVAWGDAPYAVPKTEEIVTSGGDR
jgi:HK97 family phage portal protein